MCLGPWAGHTDFTACCFYQDSNKDIDEETDALNKFKFYYHRHLTQDKCVKILNEKSMTEEGSMKDSFKAFIKCRKLLKWSDLAAYFA